MTPPDTTTDPPTQPLRPLLVPLPEAGQVLGVGRTTVYELVRDGRLATVRLGRRRLVPASALVALVEELQRQAVT